MTEARAADAAKLQSTGARVGRGGGGEMMTAYLASLKADSEVKLDQAMLEKKP